MKSNIKETREVGKPNKSVVEHGDIAIFNDGKSVKVRLKKNVPKFVSWLGRQENYMFRKTYNMGDFPNDPKKGFYYYRNDNSIKTPQDAEALVGKILAHYNGNFAQNEGVIKIEGQKSTIVLPPPTNEGQLQKLDTERLKVFLSNHLDMKNPRANSVLEAGDYIGIGIVYKIVPYGVIVNTFNIGFDGGVEIKQDLISAKEITAKVIPPKDEESAEAILEFVKIKPQGQELWEMPYNEFNYCVGIGYSDYANNAYVVKDCYDRILHISPLKDKKKFYGDVFRKKYHKEIIEQALSEGKKVPAVVLSEYPELASPTISQKAKFQTIAQARALRLSTLQTELKI